ncbi:hypothetical protein A6A19_00400 [Actinobacillus delphinicola]|uniref:ATP-binding protein n=1 Tax=Actinobacillus delphinicola TaxID=51161 RepID=UPI0024423B02|nr:ATP-binding protein [Actinobacillus delphinicola]MDG6896506.1 hypothetical protein [Actinobacillus delphinicola]
MTKSFFNKFNPEIKIFDCTIHGKVECQTFFNAAAFCPLCKMEEERKIRKEQDDAQNQIIQFVNFEKAGIKKRYLHKEFSDFYADTPRKSQVLNFCKKFTEAFRNTGENLFLLGNIGTGKTHLACCMAKDLVKQKISTRILPLDEIISEVKDTWNKNSEITERQILNKLITVEVLFIDEVGTEKIDETALRLIRKIIDSRYSEMKSTIIISNFKLESLANLIDQRSISRLCENSQTIIFNWEDFRLRGKHGK